MRHGTPNMPPSFVRLGITRRMPSGRSPKWSPEREQRVIDAISAGSTRKAAAFHAGISEDTLARWLRRADFADRLTRAEADVELRCTAIILKAATEDAKHAEW